MLLREKKISRDLVDKLLSWKSAQKHVSPAGLPLRSSLAALEGGRHGAAHVFEKKGSIINRVIQ